MDEETCTYKIMMVLAEKIDRLETELTKVSEAHSAAMSAFFALSDDAVWKSYVECAMARVWLTKADKAWMLTSVPRNIREGIDTTRNS